MAGLAGSPVGKALFHLPRLLLAALLFFANNLRAEDVLLTVNVKKPVALTSDKFLSYTLDPTVVLTGNAITENPERSVNMAKALAPAYVRIGGPRSNSYTFERPHRQQDEQDPGFTFTEADWIVVHRWAENAGLDVLACIAPQHSESGGRDPGWDSRNALDLISFSDHMGFNTSWQLGYECQTRCDASGIDIGRDVMRLRSMLDAFPRYSRSVVTGPDVVTYRTKHQQQYLQDYLSVAGTALSAITWHPDFASITLDPEGVSLHHDNLAIDRDGLYRVVGRLISKKPLWLAESKPEECKKQFLGALVWTRRLGNAAKLGVQVLMRQPIDSNLMQPTPDYWVSVLHKSLVGREVLDTRIATGNRTHVHFYCQCTKPSAKYEKGSLTIFGINLTPSKVVANLKGVKIKTLHKYILLPGFDAENRMFSQTVLLNNEPLNLLNERELPEIKPTISSNSKGVALKLPSGGIGFWVIPGLKLKSCGGLEDDNTDKMLLRKLTKRLEEAESDEDSIHEEDQEDEDDVENSSTEDRRFASSKSSKSKRRRKHRYSEEEDAERRYRKLEARTDLERLEKLLKRRDSHDERKSPRGRTAYFGFEEKSQEKTDDHESAETGDEIRAKLEEYKNRLKEHESRKRLESKSKGRIGGSMDQETIDSEKVVEALKLITKMENAMRMLEKNDDEVPMETLNPDVTYDVTSGLVNPTKSENPEDMFLDELLKSEKIKRTSVPTKIEDQLRAIYQMLAEEKVRRQRNLEASPKPETMKIQEATNFEGPLREIDESLSRARREGDEKIGQGPLGVGKLENAAGFSSSLDEIDETLSRARREGDEKIGQGPLGVRKLENTPGFSSSLDEIDETLSRARRNSDKKFVQDLRNLESTPEFSSSLHEIDETLSRARRDSEKKIIQDPLGLRNLENTPEFSSPPNEIDETLSRARRDSDKKFFQIPLELKNLENTPEFSSSLHEIDETPSRVQRDSNKKFVQNFLGPKNLKSTKLEEPIPKIPDPLYKINKTLSRVQRDSDKKFVQDPPGLRNLEATKLENIAEFSSPLYETEKTLPRVQRDSDKKFGEDPLGLRKEGLFRRRAKTDDARERRMDRRRRKEKDDRKDGQGVIYDPRGAGDSNENNFYGFQQREPLKGFPEGDVFLTTGTSSEETAKDYDYVTDDEDVAREQQERARKTSRATEQADPDDGTWVEEEDTEMSHVPKEFFEDVRMAAPRVHENLREYGELWEAESLGQEANLQDGFEAEDDETAAAGKIVQERRPDAREDKRAKETAVRKLIGYYEDPRTGGGQEEEEVEEEEDYVEVEKQERPRSTVRNSPRTSVQPGETRNQRPVQGVQQRGQAMSRKRVKDLASVEFGSFTDYDSMHFGRAAISSAEHEALGIYKPAARQGGRGRRAVEDAERVARREGNFWDEDGLRNPARLLAARARREAEDAERIMNRDTIFQNEDNQKKSDGRGRRSTEDVKLIMNEELILQNEDNLKKLAGRDRRSTEDVKQIMNEEMILQNEDNLKKSAGRGRRSTEDAEQITNQEMIFQNEDNLNKPAGRDRRSTEDVVQIMNQEMIFQDDSNLKDCECRVNRGARTSRRRAERRHRLERRYPEDRGRFRNREKPPTTKPGGRFDEDYMHTTRNRRQAGTSSEEAEDEAMSEEGGAESIEDSGSESGAAEVEAGSALDVDSGEASGGEEDVSGEDDLVAATNSAEDAKLESANEDSRTSTLVDEIEKLALEKNHPSAEEKDEVVMKEDANEAAVINEDVGLAVENETQDFETDNKVKRHNEENGPPESSQDSSKEEAGQAGSEDLRTAESEDVDELSKPVERRQISAKDSEDDQFFLGSPRDPQAKSATDDEDPEAQSKTVDEAPQANLARDDLGLGEPGENLQASLAEARQSPVGLRSVGAHETIEDPTTAAASGAHEALQAENGATESRPDEDSEVGGARDLLEGTEALNPSEAENEGAGIAEGRVKLEAKNEEAGFVDDRVKLEAENEGAGIMEDVAKREAKNEGAGIMEDGTKLEAKNEEAGIMEDVAKREARNEEAGIMEDGAKLEAINEGAGIMEDVAKREAKNEGAGIMENGAKLEAKNEGDGIIEDGAKLEAKKTSAEGTTGTTSIRSSSGKPASKHSRPTKDNPRAPRKTSQKTKPAVKIVDPAKVREARLAARTEALQALRRENESKKARKSLETATKTLASEQAKFQAAQRRRAEQLEKLRDRLRTKRAKIVQEYRDELIGELDKTSGEERNVKRREIMRMIDDDDELREIVDQEKLDYLIHHRPIDYESVRDDRRAGIMEDVETRAGIMGDVEKRAGIMGDVEKRAGIMGDVEKRAGIMGDVQKRAGIIGDMENRAGIIEDMENRAGIIGDVQNRAGIIGDVQKRAGIIGDVQQRAGLIGDVQNRAGIIGDVQKRAGIIGDVQQRAGLIGDVQNRAGIMDDMQKRAGILEDMQKRAGFIQDMQKRAGITEDMQKRAGIIEGAEKRTKYVPKPVEILRPLHEVRERKVIYRGHPVRHATDPRILAYPAPEESRNSEAIRRSLRDDLEDHKIERRAGRSYYSLVESLENPRIRYTSDEDSGEVPDSSELGRAISAAVGGRDDNEEIDTISIETEEDDEDDRRHGDYRRRHAILESSEDERKISKGSDYPPRLARNAMSKNRYMCLKEDSQESSSQDDDEVFRIVRQNDHYMATPILDGKIGEKIGNGEKCPSKKKHLKDTDYDQMAKYKTPKYARLATEKIEAERRADLQISRGSLENNRAKTLRDFENEDRLQEIATKNGRRRTTKSDDEEDERRENRRGSSDATRLKTDLEVIDDLDLDEALNSSKYELLMLIPVKGGQKRSRQRRQVENKLSRDDEDENSASNEIPSGIIGTMVKEQSGSWDGEEIGAGGTDDDEDLKRTEDEADKDDEADEKDEADKDDEADEEDEADKDDEADEDDEADDSSSVTSTTLNGENFSSKDGRMIDGWVVEKIGRSEPKIIDHRADGDDGLSGLIREAIPKLEATVTGGLDKARHISESLEKFIDGFDERFNEKRVESEDEATRPEESEAPISSDVFGAAVTSVKKFFDFVAGIVRIVGFD